MPDGTNHTRDPEQWCAEFLAPWNEHDADAATNFFAEEAVWEFTAGSEPWGETHIGQPAIRTAINAICEAIPDIHYDLVHHHAAQGHLTMEVLVTGTTREGQRLNYRACDVLALTNGKVTAKRSYRKVVS